MMLHSRQGLFLCGGPCRAKNLLIASRGRLPRQGPPSLFRPCRNTRSTLPETHRLLAGRPTLPETSSPSCRPPDLAGNIFSFLPVARPRRKHIAFLPAARPRRKHLLLLAGRPTSPVPTTRSRPPPFSFPGGGPTFSGSHRGSGRRFWPIVEQTSSLSGLCRGSDGPSAPRTVLTVPP